MNPNESVFCADRYVSPGFPARGGDVPDRARGACYPGDEPGPRCARTHEACDPNPPDCPAWEPSAITCPACLAFKERRYPRSLFLEARLLESGGAYYCPECFESYDSLAEVTLRAIEALRDALDDRDYAEGMAACPAEAGDEEEDEGYMQ